MTILKVNTLAKSTGNNISMNDPLNLKSYTTTQRNALTSVAGDVIFNSTDGKIQFYNGSSWTNA
jgi:hypothetical protein|tara:strand:- start:1 stop:192 length:192 start_codon:yes stop_codon:yes gene_type:complete